MTVPVEAGEASGVEGAPAVAGLAVRALRKEFRRADGERVAAIDGISLDVRPGEFCVLLGPSGCGKTTLLRAVAGLDDPDTGSIRSGDHVFFDSAARVHLPARHRDIGMVFQDYALWPHLSVVENVEFPLRMRRRRRRSSRSADMARARETLAAVGIGQLADSPVSSLSGGQQQRVAVARAIVSGCPTILFDEPLSNVDAKVRVQLRNEIKRLQRELGFTAVYVTHDQEEAMALADQIVVLRDGRIEQRGAPLEIYRSPATSYVADFIGAAEILDGVVERVDDDQVVVSTPIGVLRSSAGDRPTAGAAVKVCLRPEDWVLRGPRSPQDTPAANAVNGIVDSITHLGPMTDVVIELRDGERVKVRAVGQDAPAAGSSVMVELAASRCRVLER